MKTVRYPLNYTNGVMVHPSEILAAGFSNMYAHTGSGYVYVDVADNFTVASPVENVEFGRRPLPNNVRWYLTKDKFRARFTVDEKTALELAALDDPNASSEVRGLKAKLRAAMADQANAKYIDIDPTPNNPNRTRVVNGLTDLVTAGILTTNRKNEILDTIPLITELHEDAFNP
jgi:hypothetical protein